LSDLRKDNTVRKTSIFLPEDEYRHENDMNIHDTLLEKLHEYGKWPLLVYGPPEGSEQMEEGRHDGYIMSVQAIKVVEHIRSHLMKLKATAGWNSRAYFLIVVMGDLNGLPGNLLADDILAELWSERVVHTAVLLPASDSSKIQLHDWMKDAVNKELVALLEVYTLFPYQPTGHCGNVIDASLLDYWVKIDSGEGRFLRNVPLFPPKIPRDLHGCTISVSTFELEPVVMKRTSVYDDGLEIRLLNIILSHMNLSVVFVPPPPQNERWGRPQLNGSWNGIRGHVVQRRSDVAFGGMIISGPSKGQFDVTIPYLEESIAWYVPCAKTIPRWVAIMRVFTTNLWLMIVVTYVSVSALIWYLHKSQRRSSEFFQNTSQSFVICLLKQWAVMLGMSASLRVPNAATIRIVFILWMLYSFALDTVYQTFLVTHLVDPGLEKPISTEEQLLQSGLELGINPFLEAAQDDTFHSRYSKRIPCPNIEQCLRRVAEKGDLAVLCARNLGEYMGRIKFADSDGKPAYCDLDEQLTTVRVVMYMRKGDPLLYEFNKVILHVLEAGFLDHWWRDLKQTATLTSKKFLTADTRGYLPLTMYHLQSSFYAFSLGHVLSVAVFLSELITQFNQ
jgi:glutamate receptor delta-2 subunit